MAKDKKSFLLYCDQIHLFEGLDDDEAGRLIKHLFRYVNDQNPEPCDKIIKIAFEPIKHQLKRDLKSWEKELERKSEGGKKGMAKRWGKLDKIVITPDNSVKDSITSITDNVNVTVNDNDNVSVKGNQLTQWFKDFINSKDLEDIARSYGKQKEDLLYKVEEFKKHCEISYPTYAKFVFHFKNWLKKQPLIITKKRKQFDL